MEGVRCNNMRIRMGRVYIYPTMEVWPIRRYTFNDRSWSFDWLIAWKIVAFLGMSMNIHSVRDIMWYISHLLYYFLLQQHPDIKRPEIMLVVVEAVLILCAQLNFNLIQLRLIKKPNHIPTTSYPCRSPMWNSRFSRVFLFLSSSDIRFNHCIEELSAFFPLAIHKYFMNAR